MHHLVRPVLLGLVLAGTAAAQATHRSNSDVARYWINHQRDLVVPMVEAMPADKFPFAPTTGEFTGVRTFGQEAKHIAAFNYIAAAAMAGRPAPVDVGDETGPDSVRTKLQIVTYLNGSFAALSEAARAIDEGNMVIRGIPTSPMIDGATRLGYAMEAMSHTMDHYGQMVEYLRMNNVVPPRSR